MNIITEYIDDNKILSKLSSKAKKEYRKRNYSHIVSIRGISSIIPCQEVIYKNIGSLQGTTFLLIKIPSYYITKYFKRRIKHILYSIVNKNIGNIIIDYMKDIFILFAYHYGSCSYCDSDESLYYTTSNFSVGKRKKEFMKDLMYKIESGHIYYFYDEAMKRFNDSITEY
jgi:hypothetical protein